MVVVEGTRGFDRCKPVSDSPPAPRIILLPQLYHEAALFVE